MAFSKWRSASSAIRFHTLHNIIGETLCELNIATIIDYKTEIDGPRRSVPVAYNVVTIYGVFLTYDMGLFKQATHAPVATFRHLQLLSVKLVVPSSA